MAMENKRIIQLSTERTTLGDDDYTIVDSDTNGTAKYRLSRLKETDTTLSVSGKAADAAATGQAIRDEAEARAGAVTTEAEARAAAISAESQARAAADTTLGNDVQDLKSAINYSGIINNISGTPLDNTVVSNDGDILTTNSIYSEIVNVDGITKISAKVGQSGSTYNVISFFSSENYSKQTYIKDGSVPFETLREIKTFEAVVPTTAVIAVVSTRKEDMAIPEITAFDNLGEKVSATYNEVFNIQESLNLEQGGINTAGNEIDSPKRCRTGMIDINNFDYIKIDGNYAMWIAEYRESGAFIDLLTGDSGSYAGYSIVDKSILNNECRFVRIVTKAKNDSNMTPLDTTVTCVKNIKQYVDNKVDDAVYESVLSGKKLSIYGDSISTYVGWIPEGNAVWYNGQTGDVTSVSQTWWHEVMSALGLNLVINNSWSGRAVSSCRDQASGHETDAGYKESNVLQLKNGNILPEIIIVKLGINDFIDACELGNYDGSTTLPTDPTKFLDAYAIMLNLIMTNYPLAKVYVCTLMACERNSPTGFPEINERGDSIGMWNEGIKKLAHAFGAEVLDHDQCGITYYNLSNYMGDYQSSGAGLHPNPGGHALIANKTINQMDNFVRKRF